ncbi:DUF4249 domain-containing protein [Marinilabiliaceae bacterium AAT]|uniref:DUF4249 domain-containing protein n=2 Tax=Plebeiibacterium sediminum TaxID=2992112 RepID=A0AAE3M111_9BACT|nr:DUF4249 domain-containing protein [Plebeiobacterium sediminum]
MCDIQLRSPMLRKINYTFIILCSITLVNCVYKYEPDISKYENILVVEAELSNLPGPYEVKLSRSFGYGQKNGSPVCDATVKFMDKTGLEIPLFETNEGIYQTIDNSFQGIVGKSYKLHIEIDDEIYESDFETIKEPIPIDNIYWEFKKIDNNRGIDILIDAHDSNNKTHFYAWDYEETWKFHVPFNNYDLFPELEECYKSDRNTNFITTSTTNRNNDIVKGHSLKFITEEDNRLYLRYTILVKQHSLSEPTYKYFKDLNELNYNQGTLFDPIPGPLSGNIENVSGNNKFVLGYFFVSGATEKRIFIDRSELPLNYYPTNGFKECKRHIFEIPADEIGNNKSDGLFPNENEYRRIEPKIDSLITQENFLIYKEIIPAQSFPFYIVYLAKPACYTCTAHGTNVVPDFWVEKEDN